MIQAGIIGGAGYTAGELIRILLHHPNVNINYIHSKSQTGKLVSSIHDDLVGECFLHFTDQIRFDVDVLFLCMGHGQSEAFMENYDPPKELLIIDLSQDFRLDDRFVYGLPELNRAAIQKSRRIANCGCFATAIQLGLLPLAKAHLLKDEVHIHAITGSTGAGQSPSATTHFSWRNNNISIYKAFRHQHLAEIKQSLIQLQPDFPTDLNFLPLRGNFARGIFASIYTKTDLPEVALNELFNDYYQQEPFVHISPDNPNLKQVVNTNKCILHIEKHEDKVLIISLLDNLTKGASGQAVQNMNLALDLEESSGLQLKAMGF